VRVEEFRWWNILTWWERLRTENWRRGCWGKGKRLKAEPDSRFGRDKFRRGSTKAGEGRFFCSLLKLGSFNAEGLAPGCPESSRTLGVRHPPRGKTRDRGVLGRSIALWMKLSLTPDALPGKRAFRFLRTSISPHTLRSGRLDHSLLKYVLTIVVITSNVTFMKKAGQPECKSRRAVRAVARGGQPGGPFFCLDSRCNDCRYDASNGVSRNKNQKGLQI